MELLRNLTIEKYHRGLLKKEFTALEIAQAYFAHIKETDKKLGAYLSLNESNALRTAEEVDIAIAKGETLPMLAGVPIAVKDNILIKGLPATAGSRTLEHYRAAYSAGVIERLNRARAVYLGKTNLDEFGMGASTENSGFQITRNPHDPKRVPGGSSGGSAVAVAAHLALAALGSDTGGSVRQPAAFSGVVGLKTTYGSVSRSGLIALASSLDQIGPLAKTVRDAEILFEGIRGYDPLDATSSRVEPRPKPSFEALKNFTIGIPKEYFIEGLDPAVRDAIDAVKKDLQLLGMKVKEVSLPHTKHALACYYIILPAEASANLARYDGIRFSRIKPREAPASPQNLREVYFSQRGGGFGSEVKRRIILGAFVLSSGYYDSYYKKAQQVRALVAMDFENVFKDVQVLLTPTAPTPAFKIGEKTKDPLSMYLSDVFTIPANLAGIPAISIPVRSRINADPGADQRGKEIGAHPRNHQRESASLPIGFQLIGKAFHEGDLFALGEWYEKFHSTTRES